MGSGRAWIDGTLVLRVVPSNAGYAPLTAFFDWGARVGMSMVDLAFAPDVEAPAAARAELGNLGLERAEGQAVMLLASELVTNCIRHAGVGRRQRIRVRALVTDTFVRIEVIDSGAGMRVVMRTGDDHGGWGLRLVDRIADRWGVVRDAGTHVWFEIDRPGGAATEGMTQSAGAQPLTVR